MGKLFREHSLPPIVVVFIAVSLWQPVLAYPSAEQVLRGTPFQDEHIQRILDGELVATRIRQESCRELSVGLACLVKQDRVGLMRSIREGTWIAQSPGLIARGEIQGKGSLEALGGLGLGAEEGEELRRYLNARPGTELNLSPDEIALFRGLSPTGQPDKDAEALTAVLHKVVLGRYRAYRESGLQGIVPYTRRDGSQVHPGEVLLPVLEGRLLFYVNRVWTDRVGGLGCPIKKIVGRYSVLDEMREIIRNPGVCSRCDAPEAAGPATPE